MLPIYVGYDPREAIAYHTFCNSVIRNSSIPVCFIPLAANLLGTDRRDGSNDFIYSRFLVPELQHYQGWAIYADGDMICNADIAELIALKSNDPVQVVKHDYKTKYPTKYLGSKNEDYPRKNWSSLILWNCGHFANRVLTRGYVAKASGCELHRFTWIVDKVGSLPIEWNWLPQEFGPNDKAKIIHYTIGTPCFADYETTDMAFWWHAERKHMWCTE